VSTANGLKRNLPVMGVALRNIIIFVAVLSIPLAAAEGLGLTAAETSSWILALYGLPGLLSVVLALRYRQPLLLTGNIFFVIFIGGLGGRLSFPELMGAAMLAGAGVLLLGLLGLTKRFAAWIPVPIMFGLLAGAVMPFVARVFSLLGDAPVVIGATFLVYLASRTLLGNRVPAILPALIAGTVVAAASGQFGQVEDPLSLVLPQLTLPVFSLPAILTATPVFAALITLQANLPSLRFLQSQKYDPPESAIDMASGIGTMVGSFLGPTGVSLSLPVTSLIAGPEAGDQEIRHRVVYMVGGAALLVGVLAGIAAAVAQIIPAALLAALAGLSLVNVLANAVKQVTKGPLLLGPLFAFAISLSEVSFLGFGNYFWSMVIGTAVTLLLEQEGLRALRAEREQTRGYS
jgi:benzoate membrane transport protein